MSHCNMTNPHFATVWPGARKALLAENFPEYEAAMRAGIASAPSHTDALLIWAQMCRNGFDTDPRPAA